MLKVIPVHDDLRCPLCPSNLCLSSIIMISQSTLTQPPPHCCTDNKRNRDRANLTPNKHPGDLNDCQARLDIDDEGTRCEW